MSLSQDIRRNMRIDPRDPNFDPDLVATDEEMEQILEQEGENRDEQYRRN